MAKISYSPVQLEFLIIFYIASQVEDVAVTCLSKSGMIEDELRKFTKWLQEEDRTNLIPNSDQLHDDWDEDHIE